VVTALAADTLAGHADVERVDASAGPWRRPGAVPAGRVWGWAGRLGALRRRLAARPPDVVYLTPAASPLGLARDVLAAGLVPRSVPVVAHVHAGDWADLLADGVWGGLARRTARRYRRVLVPSAYAARRARAALPGAEVVVVPNTVRPALRFSSAEAEAAWSRRRGGAPVVLLLSNAIPGKGHGVLAEAAARLARDGVALRLVVAGAWPSAAARAAFGRRLDALGLSARARVEGAVDDARVRALLAEASVVAFPSTYAHESFGLALLEGMGAGCAAVAADHAAAGEVVRDGVDGRLVRLDGPLASRADAFADALADALRQPERYGRRAAQRAREAFGPDRFRDALLGAVLDRAS
jgi:glycosyltransferase involved in cell wall biosynthesis